MSDTGTLVESVPGNVPSHGEDALAWGSTWEANGLL